MSIEEATKQAVKAAMYLMRKESIAFIKCVTDRIVQCYKNGNKLLIAGNGGSLCDAMHFAEELTGQFREKRPALAAIALSDPGHMSCVANDMGFASVFSRSIEALGKPGDIFIALSTSGNSVNLIHALESAKEREVETITFLGKNGGKMKGMADYEWIVSGFTFSDRIQEAHMAAIHIIIEAVEAKLFSYALP